VNYAVRFLFGDVPRQRTGAVFLVVAALGIFGFRVQQKSGNSSDVSTGGRGGHGRTTRRPVFTNG